jgi:hypothetical protein
VTRKASPRARPATHTIRPRRRSRWAPGDAATGALSGRRTGPAPFFGPRTPEPASGPRLPGADYQIRLDAGSHGLPRLGRWPAARCRRGPRGPGAPRDSDSPLRGTSTAPGTGRSRGGQLGGRGGRELGLLIDKTPGAEESSTWQGQAAPKRPARLHEVGERRDQRPGRRRVRSTARSPAGGAGAGWLRAPQAARRCRAPTRSVSLVATRSAAAAVIASSTSSSCAHQIRAARQPGREVAVAARRERQQLVADPVAGNRAVLVCRVLHPRRFRSGGTR